MFPQTRKEHRQARRAADRRRARAQRDLHRLVRETRRTAETGALLARASLVELGAETLRHLTAGLNAYARKAGGERPPPRP
jgi:ketopantoate reductase